METSFYLKVQPKKRKPVFLQQNRGADLARWNPSMSESMWLSEEGWGVGRRWPFLCNSFPSRFSKLSTQRRAEVPMVSAGEQVWANTAPSSQSFIHLSLNQYLSRAYHVPSWAQVLRRWQLARGPTPRLGTGHPLNYRRPDRMLPRKSQHARISHAEMKMESQMTFGSEGTVRTITWLVHFLTPLLFLLYLGKWHWLTHDEECEHWIIFLVLDQHWFKPFLPVVSMDDCINFKEN